MLNISFNKSFSTLPALLMCFACCCFANSHFVEDSSTWSESGPTRTVVIYDDGTSVPVPEKEIILQETVWVNEGHNVDHTSHEHGAVQQLKLGHCTQSSTAYSGVCRRAIDGNTSQRYGKHSCTHTRSERGWWQARTNSRAHIKRIRIYNRKDCCSNRLNNFYVTVDGHRCAEYHSKSAFSVKTFDCDRVGQVIRIHNRKRTALTLCEVKVFGYPVHNHKSKHKPGRKLKLGHCTQSSTAYSGVCRRAIDGNTSQRYGKHSCTHTRSERGWWQAKTNSRAHIKQIRIYNRKDCCSNRLNNFYVTVDGHTCAEYHSKSAFSVKTFDCNRVGQVIRIHNRKRTALTLCEVKVFGYLLHNHKSTHSSEKKLKLGHCRQSSTVFSGYCSRAIDGNTSQRYGKHSCTHTKSDKGGWWHAVIHGKAHVKRIRIYNRKDCCSNRLNNFYVTVNGFKCAEYHSRSAFSVKTFDCDHVGNVITIHNRQRTPLTLCEVQVFGIPLRVG